MTTVSSVFQYNYEVRNGILACSRCRWVIQFWYENESVKGAIARPYLSHCLHGLIKINLIYAVITPNHLPGLDALCIHLRLFPWHTTWTLLQSAIQPLWVGHCCHSLETLPIHSWPSMMVYIDCVNRTDVCVCKNTTLLRTVTPSHAGEWVSSNRVLMSTQIFSQPWRWRGRE